MLKALDGYKVLDLSRYGPGKYCTVTLAQLGAEVTTIEDPSLLKGDMADFFCKDTNGRYQVMNAGKRSISLNLKSPEGKQIFYKLAKQADVVVETYRPGVLKRLGVDYETVRQLNKSIIYCSITGYGQTGPKALRAGHDLNYIAAGGILSLTGLKNGPPVIPGVQIADIGSAILAVNSILSALLLRAKTGYGNNIDIAMQDAALYFLWFVGGGYYLDKQICRRGEVWHYGSDPRYNIYETKDRKYIALGCVEQWFWENLCRAIGREDLIEDLKPLGQQSDASKAQNVLGLLREIFLSKTMDEWLTILSNVDTCFSPVLCLEEVFNDPQVMHRKMLVPLKHHKLNDVKGIAFPAKFSDMETDDERAVPSFGENTDETLKKLGYSAEDIADLRQRGVIG